MSSLRCRFSNCYWTGTEENIFHHLEQHHKRFLREPTGKLYYDFVLSDLQQPTHVLCCSQGLYWFCHTESREYTLKLGLKRDQYCEYWGPFRTQPEVLSKDHGKEVYELGFHFKQLEQFNQKMPSRKLRLYFGNFDDSDDVRWPSRFDWDRMDFDERIGVTCWKHLVCSVCSEFIRRDARFCENKHFVCLDCFDAMRGQKKLKCPVCRGMYEYDCSDDKLECWLRLLKWPNKH